MLLRLFWLGPSLPTVLLLGAAPAAWGQASSRSAADASAHHAEPPVLRAGDPATQGNRIRLGHRAYQLAMLQNDKSLGAMSLTIDVQEHQLPDGPGLLFAKTINTPRGTIYDTSVVRRTTLEPVWHHSTQPTRRMRLAFAPDSVVATVTPNDSAPASITHRTDTPTFDSAVMDEVISALPLGEGYAARLPLYIFERGGLVWFTVRVTGREQVADLSGSPTSAWVVALEGPAMQGTYWIARDSRRLLRNEMVWGKDRRMVLTPAAVESAAKR